MSEVRCPAGHFLGHQADYPPHEFTINAKVGYLGEEDGIDVYKANRPRWRRLAEDHTGVHVQHLSGDGKIRVFTLGTRTRIPPPFTIICGQKGCGLRTTVTAH